MLSEIVPALQKFRDKIYQFFPTRQDAAMEVVDALSSNTSANSVVELSLNPLHRRNYCSITRVVDEFYSSIDPNKKIAQNKMVTRIISQYCIPEEKRHFHLFAVDVTPNPRVFSPTLEDRGYVYAPNTVAGNKPVSIGHQYSIAAYLPEKSAPVSSPWIIPLSCERVGTDQRGIMVGMQQLNDCIQSQPSFNDKLCVSLGDCAYSHPNCLFEAKFNPNQVHISRARNNRVFNYPFVAPEEPKKKGRPKHYGERHDLRDQTTWETPDDTLTFELISKKDKRQIVTIECWDTMIMRGTHQSILHDYPFRLLRVRVYKESGELLFKRPLWLIAAGVRRNELSLLEIFNCYRQRFDLEHFFRFGKDRLLMNKIQTPDVNHEEAWWQLTMFAYAQLFLARKIANNILRPWEKYSPALRSPIQEKSPTQTQRDFARIIHEIGTPAKPPKPRKKSPGRQIGDLQVRRQVHDIILKSKKNTNIAAMIV
jgi:hypothetical protein